MRARHEARRALQACGQATAYVAVVLMLAELARREQVTAASVLSRGTLVALVVFWAVVSLYHWIRLRLEG